MHLHVPVGGGGQPHPADSGRASPWQSPPATILPPESGIAGLPQDFFFFNLLISIHSPVRGYYKISRNEVENPFSLISMENTSQQLPPLPLHFSRGVQHSGQTSVWKLPARLYCWGKRQQLKDLVPERWLFFIPVVKRSNPDTTPAPPHLLTCLPLSLLLLLNWNYWFQAVRMKIKELWMNCLCSLPPSPLKLQFNNKHSASM